MKIFVSILSVLTILVTMLNFKLFSSIDTKEETQNTNLSNYESQEDIDFMEVERYKTDYVPGEEPLYIDGIVVVNKDYSIPSNYKSSLVDEAKEAISQMKEDALEDGIILNVRSGHRSYYSQIGLHNMYANRDGAETANTYSAKAGHSEHQTGLAYDFTNSNINTPIGSWFDDTDTAKWLYENAHNYGFILRYPKDKTHITGYIYESWHYRYIGKEHSKYFNMNDLTLEEYLGLYEDK